MSPRARTLSDALSGVRSGGARFGARALGARSRTVTTLTGDPRVQALRDATDALLQPGQHFEVRREAVRGQQLLVFAQRPLSLREVLSAGAQRGEADCYVFSDGTRISFAGMQRQAASVAASLASRYGIGPGDRVAICAANCP